MDIADELKKNIDLTDKLVGQFEGQMAIMENTFNQIDSNLKGDDKQTLNTFRAMTNRILEKAKKGEDFSGAMEVLKTTFKNVNNGGSSNE